MSDGAISVADLILKKRGQPQTTQHTVEVHAAPSSSKGGNRQGDKAGQTLTLKSDVGKPNVNYEKDTSSSTLRRKFKKKEKPSSIIGSGSSVLQSEQTIKIEPSVTQPNVVSGLPNRGSKVPSQRRMLFGDQLSVPGQLDPSFDSDSPLRKQGRAGNITNGKFSFVEKSKLFDTGAKVRRRSRYLSPSISQRPSYVDTLKKFFTGNSSEVKTFKKKNSLEAQQREDPKLADNDSRGRWWKNKLPFFRSKSAQGKNKAQRSISLPSKLDQNLRSQPFKEANQDWNLLRLKTDPGNRHEYRFPGMSYRNGNNNRLFQSQADYPVEGPRENSLSASSGSGTSLSSSDSSQLSKPAHHEGPPRKNRSVSATVGRTVHHKAIIRGQQFDRAFNDSLLLERSANLKKSPRRPATSIIQRGTQGNGDPQSLAGNLDDDDQFGSQSSYKYQQGILMGNSKRYSYDKRFSFENPIEDRSKVLLGNGDRYLPPDKHKESSLDETQLNNRDETVASHSTVLENKQEDLTESQMTLKKAEHENNGTNVSTDGVEREAKTKNDGGTVPLEEPSSAEPSNSFVPTPTIQIQLAPEEKEIEADAVTSSIANVSLNRSEKQTEKAFEDNLELVIEKIMQKFHRKHSAENQASEPSKSVVDLSAADADKKSFGETNSLSAGNGTDAKNITEGMKKVPIDNRAYVTTVQNSGSNNLLPPEREETAVREGKNLGSNESTRSKLENASPSSQVATRLRKRRRVLEYYQSPSPTRRRRVNKRLIKPFQELHKCNNCSSLAGKLERVTVARSSSELKDFLEWLTSGNKEDFGKASQILFSDDLE